jgi:membrane protein implicated in regulation of membrane protease activity
MTLFAWYNVIFYIPLMLGLLMVLGVILGIGDMLHSVDVDGHPEVSLDHDADHGTDQDHGSDQDRESTTIFSLLGFGRAPVLIVLMSMLLIFGGTGTIINLFLAPILKVASIFVLISVGGAVVNMVALTGVIARIVARFMPTLETKSVTKQDLVGCEGSVVLDVDNTSGLIQVHKDGDVFQVPCRSTKPLSRGTPVLVMEYDDAQKVYVACRNPLS